MSIHPARPNLRRTYAGLASLALVAGGAVATAPAASAAGATYTVNSDACKGAGSLYEAVALANANPGDDTIIVDPAITSISVCAPRLPTLDEFFLQVTESVTIVGNGVTLRGQQKWITQDGLINAYSCPTKNPGSQIIQYGLGLIEVGVTGVGAPGVDVTLDGVTATNLPYLFYVRTGGSLAVTGSTFTETQDFRSNFCDVPAVLVDGSASFSLTNSTIDRGWLAEPDYAGGFITGVGDSTITVDRSSMSRLNGTGFAVRNYEGDTNIVSSIFTDAGGFRNGDGDMKIVNSAWYSSLASPVDSPYYQFQQTGSGGSMTLTASTVSIALPFCGNDCINDPIANPGLRPSMPFNVGAGNLQLESTAVGGPEYPGSVAVVLADDSATVSADDSTWIQPRAAQDDTALRPAFNQPSLLTDPPGLPTNPLAVFPETIMPLLGDDTTPGVLIDAIDDTLVTNPIDGAPITTDVLGNPRWDANGKRNIGAVQLTLAPHLTVDSTGDQQVKLSWSRPLDPPSGAITGYGLSYRSSGGAWTRINISGAGALDDTVTGLTNGTTYEFKIVAVNGAGDGPESNVVNATPFAGIGTPVVTGVGGDQQVALSWTAPSLGGRTLDHYTVLYRAAGTSAWTDAGNTTSTSLTVGSLSSGTTYEFGVFAVATDATNGAIGTTTATTNAVFPPSAPLNVSATAGNASATVTWQAPASSGTFPVTSYEVKSSPSGGSCLVQAPTLTCDITGLTNGTTYTFEVRALNGAGWGPWSPPSNAVTPRDPARLAIVITGYRATGDQANRIHVDGVTTGLVGTQVRPRVKLAGETTYRTGTAVRTVADDGTFTWQRKTNKKTYVYFLGDGVRSNRVVIAARS